jgi:hypothetical protein
MKLKVVVTLVLLCQLATLAAHAQVRAGSREYQLFEQISGEMNADAKIGLIMDFEKEFPQSKILARVYLMAVDVYRGKQDRGKINEYGEKALQLDDTNITAMMLLARNYAIEAKNLDRASDLARRAIARMDAMLKEPLPSGYSPTQWKDYLRANADSAEQILSYVNAMKARADRVKSSLASAPTPDAAKTPSPDSPQDRER